MNIESLAIITHVLKGALADELIQPLLTRIDFMHQQIADLKTALDANLALQSAAVANENALKAALTAANDQIVALQAQVANASALAPDDVAALAGMTTSVTAASQTLSDANTVDAPGA